jgi:hypothetical protein
LQKAIRTAEIRKKKSTTIVTVITTGITTERRTTTVSMSVTLHAIPVVRQDGTEARRLAGVIATCHRDRQRKSAATATTGV